MNEQTIFTDALAKRNPAERQFFLDQACGKDAALRAQVEELLAAGEGAGSFLEHPPVGLDATIDASLSGKDTVDNELSGALPSLEPCDKPDRIGKLGIYEIIEVVGQGGMGTVLRAFDTKLSRIVAVKVMAPELAANPTAVKRFLREARSAAAVVHDHVVTIHAIDDQSRLPYLVMEFIEGQTLQQKIDREGALELKQILRIGSQMAAGLAAAHKTGLIHRDVKPANILLENGVERVKITDFGLARAADDVEMTKTGLIAGTPQYMSPEQAQGDAIDSRSDLFSLGSVLYTMCAGRPPFRAETTMGTLRRVCDDVPRPIHEVNAEVPHWLEAIVDKLLAKDPADRFQTAAEVADLLSQHLAHEQNPAQVSRPTTVEAPPSPVFRAETRPIKNRWRRAAEIAGLIVSLAILFSFLEARGFTTFTSRILWFFHHELTLRLPDNETIVELWETNDEVERPNAHSIKGPWPIEAKTVVVKKEKKIRLPPGNYWLFANRRGKMIERKLLKIGWGGRQVVTISPVPSSAIVANDPDDEAPWVQLFNGKDLTGWQTLPADTQDWKVEDGVLVGNAARGLLVSKRDDYQDFHLRAQVKINPGGDSGLYFRCRPDGTLPRLVRTGYEAQIIGPGPKPNRTGSLFKFAEGETLDLKLIDANLIQTDTFWIQADTWLGLEVIAAGNRITVKVDGQTTAEYVDDQPAEARGHIALDTYKEGTRVQFRKIEIKELPQNESSTPVPDVDKQVAEPKPRRLKLFDPKVEKPAPPAWADAKRAVTVENDSWRIENDTNMGNFHILMATVLDGIPKDGLIVCRAKIKVEARHKGTWGELLLGEWEPSHFQYDWPAAMYEYRGDVPEWTAKEVRYPASVFHQKDPPQIAIRFGLHANGVLWVKDLELLHLPAEPTAPVPTEVP